MRSRRMLAGLALMAGLALPAAPAAAQSGFSISVAEQPAATLLLPYFEVDLAHPAGANTLFTVNNASASAALVHVTIWSTMHVPVHTFDVYLTGFDAQTLNVRDIISGKLPVTADDARDPADDPTVLGISNQGPFSQDITMPGCAGILPPATIPAATVAHIQASLTGQPSPLTNQCASKPDGTRIARGYITMDSVRSCSLLFPGDPGYFVNGGLGVADNRNLLWGDYTYINHLRNVENSDASPLVHITANALDTQLNAPGEYTFYAREIGFSAADNREPLSTTFLARFVQGNIGGTTLTVWRDSKRKTPAFGCSSAPIWYPLGQADIVFFDEQENPTNGDQFSFDFSPLPPDAFGVAPFPAGAQRVAVGSNGLQPPTQFGWMYLNLNTVVTGVGFPSIDPLTAQSWVTVHQGNGRFSSGWGATMLDTAKGGSAPFLIP